MAMNRYDVGDRVRCTVLFKDINGAVADPTGIVAKYKVPGGTITTKTFGTDPEVVREGTGSYYIDIDVTAAGTWYYRFVGTGSVVAAAERSFVARETQF